MAAKQRTRAYAANMSSLDGLKFTCQKQEADLRSKLISLQTAKDDKDADVTAAIYEEVTGMKVGHLIFEEYTTEVDASSRTAIHQTQGETLVCKGTAFINNAAKNVIVFREKA